MQSSLLRPSYYHSTKYMNIFKPHNHQISRKKSAQEQSERSCSWLMRDLLNCCLVADQWWLCAVGDRSLAPISNCRFSEVAKAQCRKFLYEVFRRDTDKRRTLIQAPPSVIRQRHLFVAAVLLPSRCHFHYHLCICVIDSQLSLISNIKAMRRSSHYK